jgi:hypothetical protein
MEYILVFILATLLVLWLLMKPCRKMHDKFSSVGDMLYDMGDNSLDDGDPYSVDANRLRMRASVGYMDRDQNMGYF